MKKKKMTAGESIINGLKEAIAYEKGEKTAARVHHFNAADVTGIRKKTGLTQQEFSRAFDIPLSTLRKWEQGNRIPHGPAGALLKVIEYNPKAVMQALHVSSLLSG
ncbi:MAG: helix-turn-helix domain-containing protein [Pseudomonadota bacterium]